MSIWLYLGIFGLLMVSAAASLAQTAIEKMSRVRALQLAQTETKSARALNEIIEDPAQPLNVLLMLSVAANVTATVLVAAELLDQPDVAAEAIAAAVMTFLIFVFASVVPKTYTVQNADQAALLMARPVRLVTRILGPFARLLIALSNAALLVLPGRGMPKGPFVTEEEIRHMIDVAEEEEEIEEDERELIHSIFEFGDTLTREVMVPRPDMVAIKSSSTLDEAMTVIIDAGYSRIPIYDGDVDNVIGVLYAKDLMKRMHEGRKEVRVGSLGRAPTFVPEQKRVSELLREMQEQRVHMAIVVDEYGGTAGLVTIEDLIEEIVGEIVDEYDQEEPLVEPLEDGTVRVDAKMPIDEVNDLLDVELPHEEWDTVGGLVYALTGRVPIPGEKVSFDGLVFTTERVTGRRIQKVVIAKRPQDKTAESSAE